MSTILTELIKDGVYRLIQFKPAQIQGLEAFKNHDDAETEMDVPANLHPHLRHIPLGSGGPSGGPTCWRLMAC